MLDLQSVELKEHITAGLTPILAQTMKTNGRVSKLERTALILSAATLALYASNPELLKILLSLI